MRTKKVTTNSSISIAKIISDYLFLGELNPEKKARRLYEIKQLLTPHGFEKYIQYYFKKSHNYNLHLHTETNQADDGIDLIGKHNGKSIIIQCKRYSNIDISSDEIRSFAGSIFGTDEKKENTDMYFITTTKFTKKSIDFAKKAGIICINFSDISRLDTYYPVEKFLGDIQKREGKKSRKKCMEIQKKTLPFLTPLEQAVENTNTDIFLLLKQVRKDIADMKQMNIYSIAKNATLTEFSKKRPHNTQELKKFISGLEKKEAKKLQEYGDIFLERFQYVEKK